MRSPAKVVSWVVRRAAEGQHSSSGWATRRRSEVRGTLPVLWSLATHLTTSPAYTGSSPSSLLISTCVQVAVLAGGERERLIEDGAA